LEEKEMASLLELLRYKKEIEVLHPITKKPIKKIWIRVLGDFDLSRAYKAARIASSKKRDALRDPMSEDYQDEVLGIDTFSYEEKLDLIKTSKLSNFTSEAQAHVVRPDAIKLEEISPDPDAASLEDLEKLDIEEISSEVEYREKIQAYIDSKLEELEGELKQKTIEEIDEQAKYEISNIVPFTVFLTEVSNYKILYGTFRDKSCSEPEFSSITDIKNLPKEIRDFIIEELNELELGTEEIKN
jgi:hypothetical protein